MSAPELLKIRRSLSQTPLAERHDEALRGALARVQKPLPWGEFERAKYPEPVLALAADLFHKLATGEFSAVGLFTHLTSGLALTGAPFDLVLASSRISADELRHAEYCRRMAALCSGAERDIEIPKDALAANFPSAFDAEEVDFLLLKYAAVGETIATALLTECRRRAKDPLARALFTSLVSDEVHHARFGWYYAAHRAPQWTQPERQRLADRLADFVLELEAHFWYGRDAGEGQQEAAHALGVLDSVTQRDVISDVMLREIVPALDAIGFSGSRVWEIRRRGAGSA